MKEINFIKRAEVKYWNKNKDDLKTYLTGDHLRWGDRIQHLRDGRICGWLSDIPKNNDYLIDNLNTEVFTVYKIKDVETCENPSDMFFADIIEIGVCDKHGEINKSE